MNDVTNELLSMFDARYLEHRAFERDRLAPLREQLAALGAPAAIEIGCNTGAFLIGLARRYAPRPVIGIEWNGKHMPAAQRRIEKSGVSNALLLHGDARHLVPLLIEPASLDAVCVLFPDPWWKKRHESRRVLDPVFLRVLARRLTADGALYLKSDVFDYLYRVRQFALGSGAFEPLAAEHWPDESQWTLSTRERKCMSTAIPFGRGYYRPSPSFDRTLPVAPESNDLWPIDEDLDPISLIRGATLWDQQRFAERKKPAAKSE